MTSGMYSGKSSFYPLKALWVESPESERFYVLTCKRDTFSFPRSTRPLWTRLCWFVNKTTTWRPTPYRSPPLHWLQSSPMSERKWDLGLLVQPERSFSRRFTKVSTQTWRSGRCCETLPPITRVDCRHLGNQSLPRICYPRWVRKVRGKLNGKDGLPP